MNPIDCSTVTIALQMEQFIALMNHRTLLDMRSCLTLPAWQLISPVMKCEFSCSSSICGCGIVRRNPFQIKLSEGDESIEGGW